MSDPPSLAILIPVLDRPHRIAPLIDSIEAATPQPHRILFLASPGYDAEIAALEAAGADFVVTPPRDPIGDYARKINLGLSLTDEAVLFTGADDLRFKPGWYVNAIRFLQRPRIGVVGTNDLGNRRVIAGRHSTHSLVTRDYAMRRGVIDQRGAIYCEEYWHEYVDDELVKTAMRRGAWAFSRASHVEHLHPDWGKAPSDETYALARERMEYGRRIFERRQKLWRR